MAKKKNKYGFLENGDGEVLIEVTFGENQIKKAEERMAKIYEDLELASTDEVKSEIERKKKKVKETKNKKDEEELTKEITNLEKSLKELHDLKDFLRNAGLKISESLDVSTEDEPESEKTIKLLINFILISNFRCKREITQIHLNF